MTPFTDEDLKRLKKQIATALSPDTDVMIFPCVSLTALLARLEAAEMKECNQFHCGHQTCNAWRKAAGK